MDTNVTLKDGTGLSIREITIADLEQLVEFYSALPPNDRRYLRIDVTDKALVEERLKTAANRGVNWIAAFQGHEMCAEGRLELSPEQWRENQGEIRLIVAKKFQRHGLGSIMMKQLYNLATQKKVETIVVKFMRPQQGARKICRKFGFHEQSLIPDYVRDQKHKAQDLVIMSCDMKEFWRELEHFYGHSDWQRCR